MQPTAAVAPSQSVGFDVIPPLRDHADLEALLKAQHDPRSPSFHQRITPQQFAGRFGPDTATTSRAAASYASRELAVELHSRRPDADSRQSVNSLARSVRSMIERSCSAPTTTM